MANQQALEDGGGEARFRFGGAEILLTTGANKHECQAWAWWAEADIVISIVDGHATILKGGDE